MPPTKHAFSRPLNLNRLHWHSQHFVYLAAALFALALAACQPTATPQDLPTLAVLPSLTPTEASSATPADTDTPAPTATFTSTPTFTPTPPPTRELRPTNTPQPTVEPTLAAIGTATESVLAAATFATFTPAPDGTLVGTPAQLASVRITEPQFQKEIDARLPNYPSIQSAIVSFVPSGISIQLTALGGQAFITGNVFLSVQVSGGLAAITPSEITVNAPEPPEGYVEVVNGDFFLMMVDILDTILKTRLGPDQKLANIVMNDNEMLLTLLVPQ